MSLLTNAHWAATFKLNTIRVASATVTLLVLFLFGRITGILSGPEWQGASFLNVIGMPAVMLFGGMCVVLVARAMDSMGVPFAGVVAGLMSIAVMVFIAIGDPLIWFIRRQKPDIVPVDEFKFINPRALIIVQKPEA